MTTITLPRAVVEQALEALEADCGGRCNAEYNPCWQREVAETLRTALAQQAEPVAQCSFPACQTTGGGCVGACTRAALAQLAEPVEQKDAARWRFLVDNSFDKENAVQFHVWEHSWEPHSQTGEPTEWKQRVRGPALNCFIDRALRAALAQQAEPVEPVEPVKHKHQWFSTGAMEPGEMRCIQCGAWAKEKNT